MTKPTTTKPATEKPKSAVDEALVRYLGDRYEYVGKLGSGAFGDVYHARDTMLDRDVAIKRVRTDVFADESTRAEMRERTVREAKLAAKLKHPHIVTIYDIVSAPDMSFIIMEYVAGSTLDAALRKQRSLSLDETCRILSQAAAALDFAHGHGVVHRDIKPANIMVDADGVKVMDFGIAKSDTASGLTAEGAILGTPNYMSPEQARGEPSIDGRSDLFALGCVLYECLSGRKAFQGENVMGTLMAIVNKSPKPLDCRALGLHPDAQKVLDRALAKDRSTRFDTAVAMVEALRALPPPSRSEGADTTKIHVIAPVVTRRAPGNTSSFDAHIQGSLDETTVPDLIRQVYVSRSTGILHFSRGSMAKRIYFQKGNVVFANSDVEEDRLGEFLIRRGDLTRASFERASKIMKQTGRRLGATLVEMSDFSEEGMQQAVRDQVRSIITSILEWDSGVYGFELLDKPVEEDIVLELSTADILLDGARKSNANGRLAKMLGDTSRVPRLEDNPLLLYQKMTLTPSEGFVLSRVDGMSSIADMVAVSPLGEDETLRCLYALVTAGVVGIHAASPPTMKAEPRPAAAPRPEPEKPAESASPSAAEELVRDITAKHAALETASLYELLEVSRGASDAEIKKAYYAMAKKYHPDRHYQLKMPEAQALLEELFARLTVAYEELSDPASRRKYDGKLQAQDPRKSPVVEKQKAVEEAPVPEEAARIPPEVIADRHYQRGRQHYDNEEYFDAIQCLRESVRLIPDSAPYRRSLALALAKNPKWRKEAEEHFRAALKDNEFDVESHLGLAELYETSAMPTRARKMYEKVLAYAPDPGVCARVQERIAKLGKK